MKHYDQRCEHCHKGPQALACISCGRWCCERCLEACVRCGEFVCPWCLRVGPMTDYGPGYCENCLEEIKS